MRLKSEPGSTSAVATALWARISASSRCAPTSASTPIRLISPASTRIIAGRRRTSGITTGSRRPASSSRSRPVALVFAPVTVDIDWSLRIADGGGPARCPPEDEREGPAGCVQNLVLRLRGAPAGLLPSRSEHRSCCAAGAGPYPRHPRPGPADRAAARRARPAVLGAWLGGAGRLGRGRPVQHPRTGPVRGGGRLVALVRRPARCDRRGGGTRLRRGGLRQLRLRPQLRRVGAGGAAG